jgi:hypothetical protein
VRRTIRFSLIATAFTLAACLATAAFAVPATWEAMDVTLHSEQDGGVLLVSGDLPAAAKLPAEAELSVPAGSELQWIGQILGGASADDPALQYTKTTVGGSDVYRFTLTKSRTAQIEVPVAKSQAFDGTTYSSSLAWAATQAVPEVRISLRIPAAAQIASPTAGAALLPGDSGYRFYSKTVQNVKAGDTLDLTVAYALPAAGAASAGGATAPSGTNSAVPIVLVLLVAAAFAGLVIGIRRKMSGSTADDEELGEWDDDEGVEADVVTSSDAVSDEEVGKSSLKKPMTAKTKRTIVTAAIVAVLLVAGVAVGAQSIRPKMVGDTITKTFSSAEPCANADIALAVSDGADPQKTAEQLFAAVEPIAGLTTVTYNRKTSTVQIGYCESSSSEAALRQALAPTGLVAQGGATVAPAP